MSASNKSLYDILSVKKTDSISDIKRAYLKLAKIHHPDKGGNPETFKDICRASEVLTDEKRKRLYDETGISDENAAAQMGPMNHGFPPGFPGGPGGPGGPFNFPFDVNLNDLFGGMFGNPQMGPQRGNIRKGKKDAPIVQTIPITLEQFYLGHSFEININRQAFCRACEHTGAKQKEICKRCNGQGAITQIVQIGPMAMHTTGPCLECQGKGERVIEVCGKCLGSGLIPDKKNLTIKIAPGTKANETVVFSEVCSDHPGFERPADAHIIISEDSNDSSYSIFKRLPESPQHLETHITLSLAESLVGCVIQIQTHPGYEEGLFIKLPAGSFEGDKYCLAGFGMPIVGNIGKYGDLFLCIHVSVKPEERKLLATQGRDALLGIFESSVRKTECDESAVMNELYLVGK
jgi:DnaJ-class molecular chaperone